jgi:hypothetical protein
MEKTKTKKSTASKTKVEEEGQVIVHVSYKDNCESCIRIWKSTFLFDNQNQVDSPMIHCEGISMYPVYTTIPARKEVTFTLFFKRLPKSCVSFNLVERIPEPGGFIIRNIARNNSDVYRVSLD